MSWAVLVNLLLEFFGPYIRRWIEELLNRAADRLASEGRSLSRTVCMYDLFEEARSQTYWWQWRKRAVLAVCQRVAADRTGEFLDAMEFQAEPPKIHENEERELAAVAV